MRKKFLSVMLACVLWMTCGVALTGCGKKDVTLSEISLKPGTMSTSVVEGSEFTTSTAVIVAKFSDNSKKEISATDPELTIEPKTIDTSVIGTHTITFTYKEKTTSVTVTVHDKSDSYVITNLYSLLWNEFTTNKADKGAASFNNDFYDHDQALYAGMDNVFDFRIQAKGINEKGQLVDGLEDPQVEYTIYELRAVEGQDGQQYVQLTQTEIDSYLTILENNAIKFKPAAKDRHLRFEAKGAAGDSVYGDELAKFTADVVVAEGFNVYDAYDLAMYDTTEHYQEQRAAIRAKYGITDANYMPKAMFLQAPIIIDKENFADVIDDYYVYQENDQNVIQVKQNKNVDAANTPIDRWGTGLFHRNVADGSQFDFIGNYFQIDVQDMPQVAIMWAPGDGDYNVDLDANILSSNNPITTHIALFFTRGDNITQPNTCVNWKNLFFIGNGPRNADYKYSGGIILMKNWGVNFNGYNNVTNNCYIDYFFEQGDKHLTADWNGYFETAEAKALAELDGQYTLDHCKGYSSFQNLLYCNSPEHIIVKNCSFKEAGGPAIIVDHDTPKTDVYRGQTAPCVDIIASEISSLVNADSPWFTIYKAKDLVTLLLAQGQALFNNSMDQLPHGVQTTFVKTIQADEIHSAGQYFNAMALIKGNGEMDSQGKRIYGYVRRFANETEYENYYKITGYTRDLFGLDLFANQHDGQNLCGLALEKQDIIFQSSTGGYINAGAATGGDKICSLLPGVLRANYLDGVLKSQEVPSHADISDYSAKGFDLAPLVADLKNRLDAVYSQKPQALPALYQAGLNGDVQSYQFGQFFDEIAGFDTLQASEQVAQLKAQVDAYFTAAKKYYEGTYLNVYIKNGMNVMLELYQQEA